jgi:hypothetical protein
LVLTRARIEEFSAMAPVICVAVSQRLGRSFMDNGSRAGTYPDRRGDGRAYIRTREISCEIDLHFVADTTAGAGLNNYVYAPE